MDSTLTSLERRMERLAALAAALALCAAGAVVVGWCLDIPTLKSVFPGLATMKFNTAFTLLCCSVALGLKVVPRWRLLRGPVAEFFALVAVLVAVISLAEYIFHADLRIDQLVFNDTATAANNFPGRMSQATAVVIVLLGLAIALLDRMLRLSQALSLISMVIAMLALIGYAYGIEALYKIGPYSTMALHTAAMLCVVSAGHLMARPRRCVHRLLVSETAGGALARRLLPGIVFIPLFIGGLCLRGYQHGWYQLPFGYALFAMSSIVVLALFVWWNATALDRSDQARRRLEKDRDELLRRERSARERAEFASQAKDQLLSIVSHELRTPLTPVLLSVGSMQGDQRLPSDLLADVHMIQEQIQVEVRLIDDLLDLMSLRHNKLQLHKQSVDLHDLMKKVAASFAATFEAKKVALTVETGAPLHFVAGDPERLTQILTNLLGNALKFTATGGAVVMRSETALDGPIRVTVIDNGVGFDDSISKRIFDPFEQADPSTTRRFGGLGIGLSISRQLAELHGGTIIASSEGMNRGSTFVLELPLTEPRQNPEPIALTPAHLDPINILLVEDNKVTLKALDRMLSSMGHAVTSVETAEAAMEAAATKQFDLLMSDIGLPDASGWELMRRLRARGPIRGVAISGFVSDEDQVRSREAGYYAHLKKPINFDRLIESLSRAIHEPHPRT